MTIVFFDGYCGLCSGVVDFLIARDRSRKLRYSPLQGETAAKYLTSNETTDLDTVIVLAIATDEATNKTARSAQSKLRPESDSLSTGSPLKLKKSAAILKCLKELGGVYFLLAWLCGLFPIALRDFIYDSIAKNRFKLVARRETCRVPTPEERALFLP